VIAVTECIQFVSRTIDNAKTVIIYALYVLWRLRLPIHYVNETLNEFSLMFRPTSSLYNYVLCSTTDYKKTEIYYVGLNINTNFPTVL